MQLTINDIRLYELLKNKIGQQEAEAFIQILESRVDENINSKTSVFATKEDIARLEGKIDTRVSEAKVDIIKWMIATGIGIVGILMAFIKLVH